jgi:hypothetical protein
MTAVGGSRRNRQALFRTSAGEPTPSFGSGGSAPPVDRS